METGSAIPAVKKSDNCCKKKGFMYSLNKYKYLYLLMVPGVIFFLIFSYIPMFGNIIAFQDMSSVGSGSFFSGNWVGFANFTKAFKDIDFISAFKNQLIINFVKLFVVFPCPILFALLLNEITKTRLKKVYQTIYTFPHFISWVIVFGLCYNILSDGGILNQLFTAVGIEKQDILTNTDKFRPLLYFTDMWKETGWSSIIYLAALAGINPEMYQSSAIDGANRRQQLLCITLPSIKGIISLMLILSVGSMMSSGFDQIMNLYNPSVYGVADIIDTYVFRTSIQGGQDFGYSAAIALFKGIINLIMLYSTNFIVKLLDEEGLF